MSLKFEYQHSAECDSCNEYISQSFHTQNEFIDNLRKFGWSVSKERVLCPNCKKQIKNEEMKKLIMKIRQNNVQINSYKLQLKRS